MRQIADIVYIDKDVANKEGTVAIFTGTVGDVIAARYLWTFKGVMNTARTVIFRVYLGFSGNPVFKLIEKTITATAILYICPSNESVFTRLTDIDLGSGPLSHNEIIFTIETDQATDDYSSGRIIMFNEAIKVDEQGRPDIGLVRGEEPLSQQKISEAVLADPDFKITADSNGRVDVSKIAGVSVTKAEIATADLTTLESRLTAGRAALIDNLSNLDKAITALNDLSTGDLDTALAALNDPTAAEIVSAIFAKTGITAGGTWTFAKAIKVLVAMAAGKVQDKTGTSGATQEILDPEDGTTVIAEIVASKTSPYRSGTIS